MAATPADQIPDWLRSAGELGIGSTILAVRRFNIVRSEINDHWPAAGAILDGAFEHVGDFVEEVGQPVGEQIDQLLRVVEGVAPGGLSDAATLGRDAIAKLPLLARVAGLTRSPG